MKRHGYVLAGLLVVCLASACGGGGVNGTPAVPLVPGQATVQPARFGYVADFGLGSPVPAAVWPLEVGDTGSFNGASVGVLRYDLSPLPAGAVVTGAQLKVYWTSTDGMPSSLGALLVDHLDWTAANVVAGLLTGDTLALAVATVVFPTIGIIGQPTTATVDLTSQVAIDLAAGRSTSAFRLRNETPNNGDSSVDTRRLGGTFAGNGLFYEVELVLDYLAP